MYIFLFYFSQKPSSDDFVALRYWQWIWKIIVKRNLAAMRYSHVPLQDAGSVIDWVWCWVSLTKLNEINPVGRWKFLMEHTDCTLQRALDDA